MLQDATGADPEHHHVCCCVQMPASFLPCEHLLGRSRVRCQASAQSSLVASSSKVRSMHHHYRQNNDPALPWPMCWLPAVRDHCMSQCIIGVLGELDSCSSCSALQRTGARCQLLHSKRMMNCAIHDTPCCVMCISIALLTSHAPHMKCSGAGACWHQRRHGQRGLHGQRCERQPGPGEQLDYDGSTRKQLQGLQSISLCHAVNGWPYHNERQACANDVALTLDKLYMYIVPNGKQTRSSTNVALGTPY